jgi:regulator of sigma E protease
MYIVLAILIFGLLIIVHEMGHFLAAKAVGVRVNAFSIGLGPRLFGKKIGETDFCVCALPVGGACVMEGEDEESDDSRAFGNKPAWARFLILAAGSAMNFLMGAVILVILSMGMKTLPSAVISGFPEELGDTNGGLLVGDRIVRIDGENVYEQSASKIAYLLSRSGSDTHDVTVIRDGKRVTLEDAPLPRRQFAGSDRESFGITLSLEEATFGGKLRYAAAETAEYVRLIRLSLMDLITGHAKVTDLSGPVGITAVMSSAAKNVGIDVFFDLAAFIAINLAVMNLLPLPARDGGRIFFLVVGLVLRLFGVRHIDSKYENYIHLGGLVLFLGLMVFVTFNDIVRLIRG